MAMACPEEMKATPEWGRADKRAAESQALKGLEAGVTGQSEEAQGSPALEQETSDALICTQEKCGPISGLLNGDLHFNKVSALGQTRAVGMMVRAAGTLNGQGWGLGALGTSGRMGTLVPRQWAGYSELNDVSTEEGLRAHQALSFSGERGWGRRLVQGGEMTCPRSRPVGTQPALGPTRTPSPRLPGAPELPELGPDPLQISGLWKA